MATEKRLITLDAAKKLFDDIPPFIGMTGKCVQEMLDTAPTVDAVEVTRCKECHWWQRVNKKTGYGICRHEVFAIADCTADPATDPDDFCSYGERRTDEPH